MIPPGGSVNVRLPSVKGRNRPDARQKQKKQQEIALRKEQEAKEKARREEEARKQRERERQAERERRLEEERRQQQKEETLRRLGGRRIGSVNSRKPLPGSRLGRIRQKLLITVSC